MGLTRTFILQGTTAWTVPADWNNADNSIELIGAGGGGAGGNTVGGGSAAAGGGGGEYRKLTNQTYTPSHVITIQVGQGGAGGAAGGFPSAASAGTDSFIKNDANSANLLLAKGGSGASGTTGGAGGTGGTGGTGNAGGTGGVGTGFGTGSGGAGGAGGPNGVGGAGGAGTTGGSAVGGGGGGGNGGGTAGSSTSSATGANGGNNSGGTGHGTSTTAATAGGGGGGGDASANGRVGSTGTEWDATHGSGGGAGGAGSGGSGQLAASGGLYGGGGGGGSINGASNSFSAGGTGANGIAVISYTVTAPATLAATVDGDAVNSGDTLDLGTVITGTSTTRTLSVSNAGDVTANLGTVGQTGSASLASDTLSGQTIAASASINATINLNTSSAGSKTGQISIPSDDSLSPFVINFSYTVADAGSFVTWDGTAGSGFDSAPAADPAQQGTGTEDMFGRFDMPSGWLLGVGGFDDLYLGVDPDSAEVDDTAAVASVVWYVESSTPHHTDTVGHIHPITGQATLGLLHLNKSDAPSDGVANIYARLTTTSGYETVLGPYVVYFNVGRNVWIDPTNGNDSTGAVNTSGNPVATVEGALTKAIAAYGTDLPNLHLKLVANTHTAYSSAAPNPTQNGPPCFIEAADPTAYQTTIFAGSNPSFRPSDATFGRIWFQNVTHTGTYSTDPTVASTQLVSIDGRVVGDRFSDPENTAGLGATGFRSALTAAERWYIGLNRRYPIGPAYKGPEGAGLIRVDVFQISNDAVEDCTPIIGSTIDDANVQPWVDYQNAHGASLSGDPLHQDTVGSFGEGTDFRLVIRGLVVSNCSGQSFYICDNDGQNKKNFSVKNMVIKQMSGNWQIRNNGDGHSFRNIRVTKFTADVPLQGVIDATANKWAYSDGIIGITGAAPTGIKLRNILVATDTGGWSGTTGVTVVPGGMSNIVNTPGANGDYTPKVGGPAIRAATAGIDLTDASGTLRRAGASATSIGGVEAEAVTGSATSWKKRHFNVSRRDLRSLGRQIRSMRRRR
jgi:hypothetical protein